MPAGNTYEAIATQTLGSDTATITFSSIPGTYTDLVLVVDAQTTATGTSGSPQGMVMTYNSDAGANYSATSLYANTTAGTALSFRFSSQNNARVGAITQTSSGFNALTTINIMNYSNATTYKTSISRSGYQGQYGVEADVQLWRSTSAITSVTLGSDYSFKTGSTFNLYGIKAA
jgi:hypothetical protein